MLEDSDTKEIYSADGALISLLNRGGLVEPMDSLVEFVHACYNLFCAMLSDEEHKNIYCKCVHVRLFVHVNSIIKLLSAKDYTVCSIITNILLNNWTKRRSTCTEVQDHRCAIKTVKLAASVTNKTQWNLSIMGQLIYFYAPFCQFFVFCQIFACVFAFFRNYNLNYVIKLIGFTKECFFFTKLGNKM